MRRRGEGRAADIRYAFGTEQSPVVEALLRLVRHPFRAARQCVTRLAVPETLVLPGHHECDQQQEVEEATYGNGVLLLPVRLQAVEGIDRGNPLPVRHLWPVVWVKLGSLF